LAETVSYNRLQEIEVTMEPIVVGIEMGPEIAINASGARGMNLGLQDTYLQVLSGIESLGFWKYFCQKFG
jgi:hypothetical protein